MIEKQCKTWKNAKEYKMLSIVHKRKDWLDGSRKVIWQDENQRNRGAEKWGAKKEEIKQSDVKELYQYKGRKRNHFRKAQNSKEQRYSGSMWFVQQKKNVMIEVSRKDTEK